MRTIRSHRRWSIAVAMLLVLGLAALVGVAGCGAKNEGIGYPNDGDYPSTTAGAVTTIYRQSESPPEGEDSSSGAGGGDVTGTLTAVEAVSGQKIIANAALEIEVESGKFQTVFDQARLLADRYGGYIVSSDSYASGEENSMKSGTVAIRIPAASFNQALSDAAKLGELKSQQIQTQDVTEEYVDLEARITNSEAHVDSLLALLAQAKTVAEILQVQQVLTYAQEELEQLKGRLRYLDEHTSYSTLTMSIHEVGVEVTSSSEWGTGAAFKKALHNFVDAVNAIIRGLGVLIPVLVVLAIIAYIVYRIWRGTARRNRERQQNRYQPYPQGWRGQPVQTGQMAQPEVVRQQESMPQPGPQQASEQPGPQATIAPEDQVQGS